MRIFKGYPASGTQPGGGSGCFTLVLLLIALSAGLAAGLKWRDPIVHHLGLHAGHAPAGTVAPGVASPAAGPQLWTCSMHPQVIQNEPGVCPICHMQLVPLSQGAGDGHQSGAITIDPAVVQNMGVRTAAVERGPIRRDIRAVGFLREAEPNVHEINLRVDGWIEKLYADTDGMYVEKGAPLFELYSPEIHQALSELISLTARGGHGQALASSSARRLELWGLSREQVEKLASLSEAPRTVTFFSPVDGHVLEKSVYEGAGVMAGAMLFNIVDHHLLWLDIAVFEQDLPFIAVGQPIQATLESLPGQPASGEIVFIHPHVNMDTRAASVRLAIHNADMRLRPGMYATAHLEATYNADALRVPREAVMDTGARKVAFVDGGGGHFEPRDVELGAQGSDGFLEVLAGLAEGERVVTSGQFLLDTESRLREAVQKFLSGPTPDQMADDRSAPPLESDKPAAATETSPETDALYVEYLKLVTVLGGPAGEDSPLDMAGLIGAAQLVLANEAHPARAVAQGMLDAAQAMVGAPLETQRKAFVEISDAMIVLSGSFAPSGNVTPNLFVVHCPMAPGSWIQAGEAVANPYYRDEMKACGTVERPVPAMVEAAS